MLEGEFEEESALAPIAREDSLVLAPDVIADVRSEFARYVDTVPPPARLHAVRQRLRQQVLPAGDSGVHNLEELQRLLQDKISRDAAEKINEERERRKEAQQEQARLREKLEERDREAAKAREAAAAADAARADKRWDKKWGLLVFVVTTLVSALTSYFVGAGQGRHEGEHHAPPKVAPAPEE